MIDIQLGEVTHQFMEMIWANEPIRSTRLVHMAEETLHWKKPTTYTVIRRLCEKGIIKNEESTVSALISREDFFAEQSDRFVSEHFGGSLPMFLAAFSRCNELSEEDLAYMRAILREKEGK